MYYLLSCLCVVAVLVLCVGDVCCVLCICVMCWVFCVVCVVLCVVWVVLCDVCVLSRTFVIVLVMYCIL